MNRYQCLRCGQKAKEQQETPRCRHALWGEHEWVPIKAPTP